MLRERRARGRPNLGGFAGTRLQDGAFETSSQRRRGAYYRRQPLTRSCWDISRWYPAAGQITPRWARPHAPGAIWQRRPVYAMSLRVVWRFVLPVSVLRASEARSTQMIVAFGRQEAWLV